MQTPDQAKTTPYDEDKIKSILNELSAPDMFYCMRVISLIGVSARGMVDENFDAFLCSPQLVVDHNNEVVSTQGTTNSYILTRQQLDTLYTQTDLAGYETKLFKAVPIFKIQDAGLQNDLQKTTPDSNLVLYEIAHDGQESPCFSLGLKTEEDVTRFLFNHAMVAMPVREQVDAGTGHVLVVEGNNASYKISHPGGDFGQVIRFQKGIPSIVGFNGFYPEQLITACILNLGGRLKELPDEKVSLAVSKLEEAKALLVAKDE